MLTQSAVESLMFVSGVVTVVVSGVVIVVVSFMSGMVMCGRGGFAVGFRSFSGYRREVYGLYFPICLKLYPPAVNTGFFYSGMEVKLSARHFGMNVVVAFIVHSNHHHVGFGSQVVF